MLVLAQMKDWMKSFLTNLAEELISAEATEPVYPRDFLRAAHRSRIKLVCGEQKKADLFMCVVRGLTNK